MSDEVRRLSPGAFIAVVGDSGVGKDAVMRYAAERLPDSVALFVRRAITRPAGPGEEHSPLDADAFEAAEASGAFAASWRAHDLAYGIPVEVDEVIARGGTVVANVSRAALASLSTRYDRLRVVRIRVTPEVRAARLAARGREDPAGVEARLARRDPAPDFAADLEILNDGALADAGERLLGFLQKAAARV